MSSSTASFQTERALNDLVTRLQYTRGGKIAIHLHISKLQRHRRQQHHLRIALDTFESQVNPLSGHIFQLHNGDIIFVTEVTDLQALESAINRIKMLFAEDPLVAYAGDGDIHTFCTWYRLDQQYNEFAIACRDVFLAAEQSRSLMLQQEELKAAQHALGPVDPRVLASLEHGIANADLSNIIRNQMVCTVLQDKPLQPVFQEFFVSIADLQAVAAPGTDLLSNRWLFQYLTLILDRRMMSYVEREPLVRSNQAFSLNMNVQSILSPQFQKFDASIPTITRGRLVIELQLIDIFADLGAYIFARDYLQERGYRVCIDGLTHITLRYVDRARLGADLVKIYWSPDTVGGLEKNSIEQFKALVMQAGQARTILCRCEDKDAIDAGMEAGIIMFQGRYIERLYNQQREQARRAEAVDGARLTEAPVLRATRVTS